MWLTAAVCLWLLASAATAPPPPQTTVRTFARFDREITTLWPGENGDILVEADGSTSESKGRLWIVNRRGKITWRYDLPVRDLPPTDVGWAPNRIIFESGKQRSAAPPQSGKQVKGEWVLMSELGQARKIRVAGVSPLNWLRPLPVILWTGSEGRTFATDEDGNELRQWDLSRWPRAFVDVAVVSGKPHVAIACSDGRSRTPALLDENGRVVREWEVGATWWWWGPPRIDPQAGLVAIIGGPPEGGAEIRLFDLAGRSPTRSIDISPYGGFNLRFSPGGTRLGFWGSAYVGLIDLSAHAVQWRWSYDPYGPWWIYGMQCNDLGEAAAVVADHATATTVDLYFFDRSGTATLLWRSPKRMHCAPTQKGTPVLVDWASRYAYVRYGSEIVGTALPDSPERGR